MLLYECALWSHQEDFAASLCFQFTCTLLLWKYDNNLARPKPVCPCSFCLDLCDRSVLPPALLTLRGGGSTVHILGLQSLGHKQKKTWWRPGEIWSNRMLRSWQVWPLLAGNEQIGWGCRLVTRGCGAPRCCGWRGEGCSTPQLRK